MKRNRISEATGSGNAGHFKVPIVLSPQPWKENQVAPFINPVYSYDNAELAYEEADGDFKESPEQRAKIERRTDKIAQVDAYLKSFYTGQNDEDGSNVGDVENPEKIIQQAVGPLKEDLAVWFGTKKKPKGSKQPKGPWVNICRKKEGGGHPPCGRPDANPKGYPKCRAAGVAAKMSDSQKRAACSQKRREEKKDPKIGKGNKPTMVSYKPKNESMKKTIKITESELIKLVKQVLTEQTNLPNNKENGMTLFCSDENPIKYPTETICLRPTKTGTRNNDSITMKCEPFGPTVYSSFKSPNEIGYSCSDRKIIAYNDNAYDNFDDVEGQKQLDSKWLSKFCNIIKQTPKRFKACHSQVR